MLMKRFLLSIVFPIVAICLVFAGAACSSDNSVGLIAPGASLQKIQSGFTFTEGPAADADGNIYFTDIPNEQIFKWRSDNGSISMYRENTGKANGLMFDGKERLLVCEMGNNRVTRDDMSGNLTVLADSYNGNKLHMPNDLWIDPEGGVYFSDFLGPGDTNAPAEGLQIYYIPPDGNGLVRVTHDLTAPNGLIGTPDGKTLYVADMGQRKTLAYKIQPDGTLTNARVFCEQGSDGMSLDERGNVYVTGDDALSIYNSKGGLIEQIPVPERPANMSFGGKARKTLFITAMTSVYSLEMTVRGALTPLDLARK